MQRVIRTGARVVRVLSLTILSVLGTVALMLAAPGFFTDMREMDGRYAERAVGDLAIQHATNGSLVSSIRHMGGEWMHGNLGVSRQFDVPVSDLLKERCLVTGKLLLESLLLGWALSFAFAVLLGLRSKRYGGEVFSLFTSVLLCVPIAVMATACLLVNSGGPVLVLAVVVGCRDFKMAYRMLRRAKHSPALFFARSQGFRSAQALRVHVFHTSRSEWLALFTMSFVVALSAVVPVEVIFDLPGVGQLAWSAAMNRDLPVLVAVTALLACLVGSASLLTQPVFQEAESCV